MSTETTTTKETVTIDGVVYIVEASYTPEQTEKDGHHNTARVMRQNKQARSLWLRRPKGKKMFTATQFLSGNFSKASQVGSW